MFGTSWKKNCFYGVWLLLVLVVDVDTAYVLCGMILMLPVPARQSVHVKELSLVCHYMPVCPRVMHITA